MHAQAVQRGLEDDLAGQPADMDAVMAVAAKHKLWVIEDNAQAVDAAGDTFKIGRRSITGLMPGAARSGHASGMSASIGSNASIQSA